MWRYEARKDSTPGSKIVEINLPGGHRTVLRHVIVRHSPDGFQWGYNGSRPAELALNMLFDCLTRDGQENARELTEKFYQAFKHEFIANAPNHLLISSNAILDWIEEKLEEREQK